MAQIVPKIGLFLYFCLRAVMLEQSENSDVKEGGLCGLKSLECPG